MLRVILNACLLGIIVPVGIISAAHPAGAVASEAVDRIFSETPLGNRDEHGSGDLGESAEPERPHFQGSISAPAGAPDPPPSSKSEESPQAIRSRPATPAPAAETAAAAPPAAETAAAAPPAPPPPAISASPVQQVVSTAYCLTGRMASGRLTYWGAAAMNGVPLGARYHVLDGPRAGSTLVVEDRVGRGSTFDIAYPGSCGGAMQYGRRTISIQRV